MVQLTICHRRPLRVIWRTLRIKSWGSWSSSRSSKTLSKWMQCLETNTWYGRQGCRLGPTTGWNLSQDSRIWHRVLHIMRCLRMRGGERLVKACWELAQRRGGWLLRIVSPKTSWCSTNQQLFATSPTWKSQPTTTPKSPSANSVWPLPKRTIPFCRWPQVEASPIRWVWLDHHTKRDLSGWSRNLLCRNNHHPQAINPKQSDT